MAVIVNTRTVTMANAMTDTRALVVCKDVFDVATIGTDFSFDPLNPLAWSAAALPATDAQLPAMVLNTAYISAAGSGGANGTFALAISGGGGAGAAGTFTVAGGAVTDVSITSVGAGYTSNPTIALTASAGLTGASVLPIMADVLNVARDVQPALARTKRIGFYPNTYAARPTFDGKGAKFVNGTTTGMMIGKGGVHPGKVCEPYHEGFVDFVEVVSFKADGFPNASAVPYNVTGGGGGFSIDGSFRPTARENAALLGGALSVGELYTLGKRVRFNVGAGTSTIIGYLAHGGVVVATAQVAGKATTAYTTATAGTAIVGSQSGSAATAWHGPVYHLYREFIGVSGRSDADVLELVQRIHDRAASRYA